MEENFLMKSDNGFCWEFCLLLFKSRTCQTLLWSLNNFFFIFWKLQQKRILKRWNLKELEFHRCSNHQIFLVTSAFTRNCIQITKTGHQKRYIDLKKIKKSSLAHTLVSSSSFFLNSIIFFIKNVIH